MLTLLDICKKKVCTIEQKNKSLLYSCWCVNWVLPNFVKIWIYFTKLCWNIICNKNKSILSINLYHCKNSINLTNCSVKILRLSYIFRGRSKIFVEITIKHLPIGLSFSLKKKRFICAMHGVLFGFCLFCLVVEILKFWKILMILISCGFWEDETNGSK